MTTASLARDVFLLLWMAAAAWGLGAVLLRVLRLSGPLWGTHFIRLAAGMGILGHLTLVLGALLPLSSALTWGLLGAGGIACLATLYAERRQVLRLPSLPRFGSIEALLVALIVLDSLFSLVRNGLVPPLFYDEVAYHLGIPQVYIQTGHVSYIPFIPHSNWPLETEMLFLLGLLVGSEGLSHLLTWAALVMLCLALISFGKRCFSARTGLAAAAVFSATPMVTSLSGTALIEVPLALFTFLAVGCFLLWVRERDSRYWVLSAILVGLAASTKFNAALVAAVLGVSVAAVGLCSREGLRAALGRFAGFGLVALAVVAPWYVNSWLYTGNPVWPFLMQVFPTHNWDSLVNSYFVEFIQKPNLTYTVPNFFYAFWLISADYAKIGPLHFRLGWTYLAAAPLVGLAWWKMGSRNRRLIVWLVALALVFYVLWFYQTHQARFMMPVVPVMALAVGAAAAKLVEAGPSIARWGVLLGLTVALVANSWVLQPSDLTLLRSNEAYILGSQDREAYLRTHVNSYDAFAYANATLPSDSYVLLAMMESRGYYLDRRYMWLNPTNQRDLKLDSFENVDQFAADLALRGFTHVLYNKPMTDQFLYLKYGPQYAQLIRQLLAQYGELMYTSDQLDLYRFVPQGIARQAVDHGGS